jgi:hypothetical protein
MSDASCACIWATALRQRTCTILEVLLAVLPEVSDV